MGLYCRPVCLDLFKGFRVCNVQPMHVSGKGIMLLQKNGAGLNSVEIVKE